MNLRARPGSFVAFLVASQSSTYAGRLRVALATLAVSIVSPALAAPVTNPAFAGVVCETIQVPMRDGTLLTTDKYSPTTDGKLPVVMLRNPYGHLIGSGCFKGLGSSLAPIAQHGYHALAQECRGTDFAQGPFREMVQEAQDGYDAIEWAGTQSWSTGKVGLTSGSYLGLTQWQPAIHTPPHLAAINPQITASDYHDNWQYVNGVFDLWFGMSWPALAWVGDQVQRFGRANNWPPGQADSIEAQFKANVNANLATKWVWQLPLTGFDQFTTMAPYFYDWIDHPFYDDYWASLDVETRYADVKVPALVTTDWFDIFQVGAFRNYIGMRTNGGTAAARAGTKLYVGAYGHAGDSGKPTFGSDAALLPTDTLVAFYDRYLKGIENGWESTPNVKMYVLVPPDTGNTGSGFYVTGATYPLPGSETINLYLASRGHANTSGGDGQLVGAPTERGTVDRFEYDPANPVPTTGGNMCCNGVLLPDGAQDQTKVELRNDVLVYSTGPLAVDVAAIGPVEVTLWARSSAPDTDFTAKLVDVHLDGVSHNVLDRVVRASLRNGSKLPPDNIKAGEAYEYKIPLGNAGTIFRKGHRIRLEISSSSFPHYSRNLNTGMNSLWTSDTVVARQTILHDDEHPSRLVLNLAPGIHAP